MPRPFGRKPQGYGDGGDAERYAALGRAEQVVERVRAFPDAGARHIVLDFVGPYEERPRQIDAFAREVMLLLADLRTR